MTAIDVPDAAGIESMISDTPTDLFIGGESVAARSGRRFVVEDPSVGQPLTEVAEADAGDVDDAVAAATAAATVWTAMTPAERGGCLWRLADLVEQHLDELALLDTLDNGKPLWEARVVDVPLVISIFRYYAGWCTKIEGATLPVSTGAFHTYTRREPLGVVGAITPWNFPLLMCAYKLGPALAAGNTIVLKPAEQTPLSALRLAALSVEAGFPPGTINVVPGFGETAGARLASHPGVAKISFTGETKTGETILHAAAPSMKRVTLELGGKSPNIIFADADLDAAAAGAFGGIFFNQGQCCVAGSRLLVERSVYPEVLDRLAADAGTIRLGPGIDASSTMGPLVSREQRDRVAGYIDQTLADGATLVAGGPPPGGDGYFVTPTIFADVHPDMAVMREEVFGPVLAVAAFDREDEVVALANAVPYGLAAGLWTTNLSRGHRLAARLQAGTVWVNCYAAFDPAAPYGGYKLSGYGRELGAESLDNYLQTKTVWIGL